MLKSFVIFAGRGVSGGLVGGTNNHLVQRLEKGDRAISVCATCGCLHRMEGDQSFQIDQDGELVPREAGSVFARLCSRRFDRADLTCVLDWTTVDPKVAWLVQVRYAEC